MKIKTPLIIGCGYLARAQPPTNGCAIHPEQRAECVQVKDAVDSYTEDDHKKHVCELVACCWDASTKQCYYSDARAASIVPQPAALPSAPQTATLISEMTDAKLLDISKLSLESSAKLDDATREEVRKRACANLESLPLPDNAKAGLMERMKCPGNKASAMSRLDQGNQSQATMVATKLQNEKDAAALAAAEQQRETLKSIQSILIQKLRDRLKEENPDVVGDQEDLKKKDPAEFIKQLVLTDLLATEEDPAAEDPDTGDFGQRTTRIVPFVLPEAKLDYALVDWEILERCFNQRKVLKETHNCYEKVPGDIYNKFSCLGKGCIYDDGDCFFCAAAYENMEANARSLRWIKSSGDVCVVQESDKLECPDFSDTPLNANRMQLLSLTDPKMNQLMTAVHINKMEQNCRDAGCCYERDITPLKRAIFAADNPISQLIAKKLIPDSDRIACYKKAEVSPMMRSERCMPDRAEKKCGQVANAPTQLAAIDIDQFVSDESRAMPWMVALAATNDQGVDEIKCSGVLICSQWLSTAQSCMRQYFAHKQPIVYMNTGDISLPLQGDKFAVAEVVHHPLYEPASSSSRAHIASDLTLIKLMKETPNMPICLPKPTDTPIGENHLIYSIGLGARLNVVLPPLKPALVKIDKFASQDVFKCVDANRHVDFLGAICMRSLENEEYLPETTDKYTTGFSAISTGDRGGAAARYHKTEEAWVLDGIIAGAPSTFKPTDGPAVSVHINDNLSWIEDVTNGCCKMVDFSF